MYNHPYDRRIRHSELLCLICRVWIVAQESNYLDVYIELVESTQLGFTQVLDRDSLK